MKTHHHHFSINETVFDTNFMLWARVVRVGGQLEEEGGNCVLLEPLEPLDEEDREWMSQLLPEQHRWGDAYLEPISDVYQIAPGLRTACSGDIVCYEHNETMDDYPYYCPELDENFFSCELINENE